MARLGARHPAAEGRTERAGPVELPRPGKRHVARSEEQHRALPPERAERRAPPRANAAHRKGIDIQPGEVTAAGDVAGSAAGNRAERADSGDQGSTERSAAAESAALRTIWRPPPRDAEGQRQPGGREAATRPRDCQGPA